MILQEIISKFVWTPYGIQCPDYATMKLAHKFLREAILDRHLCVCKVIGFEIKSATMSRAHTGTYIARHKQIAESYPEVMLNLSDKVFMTSLNGEITCGLETGQNTTHDTVFRDSEGKEVPVLFQNPDICRVIDKTCALRLKVVYDCGYRYCQANSKRIGSDFFPCYTDFYVGDFFRVLPPEPSGNIVSIRYYNGADVKMLQEMLQRYWVITQSGSLRKEEREWLQSFMQ